MGYEIFNGDCRDVLDLIVPDASVQMCVTSPPYFGLRDYGVDGQLGLEETPEEYIANLVEVFRSVKRVLKDDGTLWLNIGDSYARTGGSDRKPSPTATAGNTRRSMEAMPNRKQRAPDGLKEKDLIGIPWPSPCAPMAGTYVKISFGISRTQCLSPCGTAAQRLTNIFSCFPSRHGISSTRKGCEKTL